MSLHKKFLDTETGEEEHEEEEEEDDEDDEPQQKRPVTPATRRLRILVPLFLFLMLVPLCAVGARYTFFYRNNGFPADKSAAMGINIVGFIVSVAGLVGLLLAQGGVILPDSVKLKAAVLGPVVLFAGLFVLWFILIFGNQPAFTVESSDTTITYLPSATEGCRQAYVYEKVKFTFDAGFHTSITRNILNNYKPTNFSFSFLSDAGEHKNIRWTVNGSPYVAGSTGLSYVGDFVEVRAEFEPHGSPDVVVLGLGYTAVALGEKDDGRHYLDFDMMANLFHTPIRSATFTAVLPPGRAIIAKDLESNPPLTIANNGGVYSMTSGTIDTSDQKTAVRFAYNMPELILNNICLESFGGSTHWAIWLALIIIMLILITIAVVCVYRNCD